VRSTKRIQSGERPGRVRLEARARPVTPAALTVVIGHNVRPVREGALALGWIYFDQSTPGQQLYISYANVSS
jgi:hypothetical protein